MRTLAAVFLLVLVAGCSTPTAAPPPAIWAFKGAVGKQEACDVRASQTNPVLGDIQAFALEPNDLWLPGYVTKINWVEVPGTPGEMDVELRRPGSDAVVYRLHGNTGPSLISFPESGCWDLTVRTSSKSGTTRLYLGPARPVGLTVAGADPLNPRDATFEWTDAAVGLQLLDAAAAMSTAPAPAKGRKSAALLLVWQADDVRRVTNDRLGRWASPLVYVPASKGEGAQIIMQKSLITGDCRDFNVPVAASIKPELASQIEKQLGGHWRLDDSEKQPWQRYDGACSRFDKP